MGGMSKLEERFEKIRLTVKENSEGAVNHKIVEDIKVSYKIFNFDYEELLSFAGCFNESSSAKTWSMDSEGFLGEVSKETLKLLNNYVLASKSLRDHTKVFVNSHYKNSRFNTELDGKIKEVFGESQLLHFVQELRNYTFNKDLPVMLMGTYGSKEGNTLGLDMGRLHEWSGWTNHTKAFIDTLEEKVELSKLIKQYWIEVEEFYQWFNSKLESISLISIAI